MDKEIEEILKDIERFFLISRDAERKYMALSLDERAQLPEHLRARFDSLSQ